MLQKPNVKSEGFTLIELMIVIAIIGILAAIAIPNFISYRDKSYCSAVESDAQTILAAISDYFSNPDNVSVSEASPGMPGSGSATIDGNIYSIDGDIDNIVVTVTDVSERCPLWDDHTISKKL